MALSEEQRRKLAAKAAAQKQKSGSNSSEIRRVSASSTPSSFSNNSNKKGSFGGGDKKKLLIGVGVALALIVIGILVFSMLNKKTPEEPAQTQPVADTVVVPQNTVRENETTNTETESVPIVDNRNRDAVDEEPTDVDEDGLEEDPLEDESQESETSTESDGTAPIEGTESYISIVTPKIDEPELLESKLRTVLGQRYEKVDDLENYGISILSYDRTARTGYVRISKALVDSGYDIGDKISVPLSVNKDYEDGTQTARVTYQELCDLIDALDDNGENTAEPTRNNNDNTNDTANGDVHNPVVEDSDNPAGTDENNTNVANENSETAPVGTMSGGEDFANSCYRVDETQMYDFDYLIQHIQWSLSMNDRLVSVSSQNMTLDGDTTAREYVVITMDPGIFCPSGRINFADFKKDLEASPYFISYQRSGNTFKLITDAAKIRQGYAGTALANAIGNNN